VMSDGKRAQWRGPRLALLTATPTWRRGVTRQRRDEHKAGGRERFRRGTP